MQREVLQLKREMNSTSSQDEFAKWAKLRRRHDKCMEEYEAISACSLHSICRYEVNNLLLTQNISPFIDRTIAIQKTSFDWSVKGARWLSTNGLKTFLQFWYMKTPVFALPADWFPYYIQWVLSFPRAPLGCVSIQVWSSVCATAIAVVAELLGSLVVQIIGGKQTTVPSDGNNTQNT